MQATPDGEIRRLVCMQAHQRLLVSVFAPEQTAYLPVMQCSIYLRGPSGPIHRPLHWIGSTDVLGWGGAHGDLMLQVMRQLAGQRSKGPPVQLMITGRDGRLLMVVNMAMHNDAARRWASSLQLAVAGHGVSADVFCEMLCKAEADLMPVVHRQGCMRPLMPVAVGGQHKAVQGQLLQAWLLKHGWLDPRQVGCDDADGGAE